MGKNKLIEFKDMPSLLAGITNIRTKAMVATQYALAARAGELVEYRHRDGRITHGLLKSNIVLKDGVWYCSIPNFKNPKLTNKLPYLLPLETWVFEPIKNWLDICGERVFDLKVAQFRFLVDKALPEGFSSHALRHSRLTHLVTEYGFNAYEIQMFAGHARLETSTRYVHVDLSGSAKKMEAILRERENSN